eukprot:1252231-Rhodomonas_salina.1
MPLSKLVASLAVSPFLSGPFVRALMCIGDTGILQQFCNLSSLVQLYVASRAKSFLASFHPICPSTAFHPRLRFPTRPPGASVSKP